MNFVYGGLLVAIVVLAWIGIFPLPFLPVVVIALGALIFITPIDSTPAVQGAGGRYVSTTPRPFFQKVRQYFFGAYLILAGLASYVDIYTTFPWATNTSVYSLPGQIILLLIGAIYFLSAFGKTRAINISSI